MTHVFFQFFFYIFFLFLLLLSFRSIYMRKFSVVSLIFIHLFITITQWIIKNHFFFFYKKEWHQLQNSMSVYLLSIALRRKPERIANLLEKNPENIIYSTSLHYCFLSINLASSLFRSLSVYKQVKIYLTRSCLPDI